MYENLPRLRKKAMQLPLTPGVYLMKNKKNEIIYVGKAKALKNRVSQYFGSQNNHGVKVRRMVENVEDFDYILCDSEFEALVLECSLIKQHAPKYNILLKDDKGYHYIKITHDGWRDFRAVKQKLNDGADYIGPYTGSFGVTNSVDAAKKVFRLPRSSIFSWAIPILSIWTAAKWSSSVTAAGKECSQALQHLAKTISKR